jgi:hypothetical protein
MTYATKESLLAATVAEKFPDFTEADNLLTCLQDHISESRPDLEKS